MKEELFARIVFSLFVVLMYTACAQKQYKFEYINDYQERDQQAQDKPQTVWPLAPEKARYKYLGEILGEVNFKEIKGSEGSLRKGLGWLGKLVFGEATPLRIYRPQSGAFDKKNRRLYVTDVGQKKVFIFDLLSGKVETWEGSGIEQGFKTPIAVTVLKDGEVLVTDADLGYVLRFAADGKYLGKFGDEKLQRPTGITHDPEFENIYVADSQAHQIHVFARTGKWLSSFGGKGAVDGKFNAPTHLVFSNKILHVSDTLNARVQLFGIEDLGGLGNIGGLGGVDESHNANSANSANNVSRVSNKWIRSFGKRGLDVGNMPRPKGVAVDSDENIYVIESYYDHMLMFNQQGQGLMAIGGSGKAPGQFDLPAGIWVDDSDRIYIADMFNQRIVVFQYLSQKSETR